MAKAKYKEKQLLDWVHQFVVAHNLWKKHDHVVMGLSGGQDSMLLAFVLNKLYLRGDIAGILFVHVDHHLRAESSLEGEVIASWCKHMSWPLKRVEVKDRAPQSNIEMWAREQRYFYLNNVVKNVKEKTGACVHLALAHHIDDSFEWHLRELVCSSTGKNTFGIPVKNGFIKRPFHCLSKKHISLWCKQLKIPHIEDPSNSDYRFERNFIRHVVKEKLLSRFNKGLAHFCDRGNTWAKAQGLWAGRNHRVRIERPYDGVSCLYQEHGLGFFIGLESELASEIRRLSSKERGELRRNIKSLINGQKNGKRGPMSFSGGVKAFMYPGQIVLCNERGLKELARIDLIFSQLLSSSQIPVKADFFKINQTKMYGLSSLKSDPLMPLTCAVVQKKKWWMRPLGHIALRS